jgi:hypothetical protein
MEKLDLFMKFNIKYGSGSTFDISIYPMKKIDWLTLL